MSSQGRQVQSSQNAQVRGSESRNTAQRGGRGGQGSSGGPSRGGNTSQKSSGSFRGSSNRGAPRGSTPRGRGQGRGGNGAKGRPPRDDNRRSEEEEDDTVEDVAEEDTEEEQQPDPAKPAAAPAAAAKQSTAAPTAAPAKTWAALASKPAPAPAPAPVKAAPAATAKAPQAAPAKQPVAAETKAAPAAKAEPAKEDKPAVAAPAAQKPAEKVAEKFTEKPAEKPVEKPAETKPVEKKAEAASAPAVSPAPTAAPEASKPSPAQTESVPVPMVPPARTASAPPVLDETLGRPTNPQVPSKSYPFNSPSPASNPFYPQTYHAPQVAYGGYGPGGVFIPAGGYVAGNPFPAPQPPTEGYWYGGVFYANPTYGSPQAAAPVPNALPKRSTPSRPKIIDPNTGLELDMSDVTSPSTKATSASRAPPGAPQELIMAKEAEAKRKAEEEAKKKAEEEEVARKKAEEEAAAKKKAEEEAAKKKAEEEEAARKKKAEEEAAAKKKAEEEAAAIAAAKKKAEEEAAAKKKAEEEAAQKESNSRGSDASGESDDEDWEKRDEDQMVREVKDRKINYDLNPTEGWRPDNPSGIRMYSREFLLQLQEDPLVATIKVDIDPDVSKAISEGQPTGRGGRGGYRSGSTTPRDSPRGYDKGGRGGRGGRGGKDRGGKRGGGLPPGSPKDNRPPTPLPERTENAWVRPKGNDKDVERKMRGLLNKLTPEKFDRLLAKLLDPKEIPISEFADIATLIDLIFENALLQTKFSSMYAELCSRLSTELPVFPIVTTDEATGEQKSETVPFKRIMLNKCQYEFENRKRPPVIPDDLPENSERRAELELEALKTRQRNLGLMKFIGELFKKRMLGEKIMHHCLMGLLAVEDNEEDLKHFCEFISTVGADLDNGKDNNKQLFNYYMSKCNEIITAAKVSSRIRFLLLDVIDLRKKNWESKKAQEGPKTLQEVHADLAKAEREKEIALREQERSSAALRRSGRDEFRRDMVPASPGRGTRGGKQQAEPSGGEWNRVGGGKDVRGGRGGARGGHRGGGIVRGGGVSLASSGSIPASAAKDVTAKNMFGALMGDEPEEEDNIVEEEDDDVTAEEPEVAEEKPAHERTEVLAAAEQYKKGKLDEDAFQQVLEEHILDEMFESGEIAEAVESVRQLHAVDFNANLVQFSVWHALEQNRPQARVAVSKFLEKICKSVSFFTPENFVDGINGLFELASEMTLDIAKQADIWFGEFLGFCATSGIISAETLVSDIWSSYRKSKDTRRVFGATIAWIAENKGADAARDFISQSSFKLDEFVSDPAALTQELKIAHLFGPVVTLESLIAEDKPAEEIVSWIQSNVQKKDAQFARRLATAVFSAVKTAEEIENTLTKFKTVFETVLNAEPDDANALPVLFAAQLATHQRLGGAESLVRIFEWFYVNHLVRIKRFKAYIDDESDETPGKTAQLAKIDPWYAKTVEAALAAKKAGK